LKTPAQRGQGTPLTKKKKTVKLLGKSVPSPGKKRGARGKKGGWRRNTSSEEEFLKKNHQRPRGKKKGHPLYCGAKEDGVGETERGRQKNRPGRDRGLSRREDDLKKSADGARKGQGKKKRLQKEQHGENHFEKDTGDRAAGISERRTKGPERRG